MSDIYELLSKHFLGETTKEEELLVQQFKLENLQEYETLQSFWKKEEIVLVNVNTEQAWGKVVKKAQSSPPIAVYRYLKFVASAAAIFLLVSVAFFIYNSYSSTQLYVKVEAKEQNKKMLLEDGSIVYLAAGASFLFPKSFSTDQREVHLEGEAFFDVAKDTNRPFIIHTNHSDIEVVGTSFNIKTVVDHTEIAVATGKVEVRSLFDEQSSLLTPNQSARVTKDTLSVYASNNQNYLAWKTGVFHFEKTPIKQVVEELNTYYNDQILLSQKEVDCLLSSSFHKLKLKEVIEIIELSCNLKLTQNKEIYELH